MFLKDKYLVRVSISAIKPWLVHKEETHSKAGGCSVFTCTGQGQGQNIDKITANAQLCNPMGCFCTFLCVVQIFFSKHFGRSPESCKF